MKPRGFCSVALLCMAVVVGAAPISGADSDQERHGKRLFERETFDGNGRTCLICHSKATGTVSPENALRRFIKNPNDPLFLHDGSDDGLGNGVTRMLTDATV